jgi:peptidoglycan hydrolase-like protein with peptidoglycan-binding domain
MGWVNSFFLSCELKSSPAPLPFVRNLYVKSRPRVYGLDVKATQLRLRNLGYTDIGEVDGYYGPNTEAVVKTFQEINGLEVDGVVGRLTWNLLFSDEPVPEH